MPQLGEQRGRLGGTHGTRFDARRISTRGQLRAASWWPGGRSAGVAGWGARAPGGGARVPGPPPPPAGGGWCLGRRARRARRLGVDVGLDALAGDALEDRLSRDQWAQAAAALSLP